MDINIFDLYNTIPLNFTLNLAELKANLPRKRVDRLSGLNATNALKDKLNFLLEEHSLTIHNVKKDAVVVKKGDKFGIVLVRGDQFFYTPPTYQYVAGCGENIFAVDNNKVFRISANIGASGYVASSTAYEVRISDFGKGIADAIKSCIKDRKSVV